jgi:cobalt-zinc-cadmium efflux system protein
MGSDHGHAGHSHGVTADADRRYLVIALSLIVAFMLAEVVVGLVANSLALLADAGHMTSDAAALGLGILAINLAARPAVGAYTFGLRRAEILSAQANGITLLGLAIFFIVVAIRRLVHPPDVHGGLVLVVALVGVAVNLAATLVLLRANRESMNIEGSFQHILTDLYAFVATVIAGAIIMTTGFTRADPIASLFVAGLMVKAGYGLLRDSWRIFLEAAPRGLNPDQIEQDMRQVGGILDIYDFHVWEVTSGFPALSAHVLVEDGCDCHERRLRLEQLLVDRYRIDHATLQVDHPHNVSPAQRHAAEAHKGRGLHVHSHDHEH